MENVRRRYFLYHLSTILAGMRTTARPGRNNSRRTIGFLRDFLNPSVVYPKNYADGTRWWFSPLSRKIICIKDKKFSCYWSYVKFKEKSKFLTISMVWKKCKGEGLFSYEFTFATSAPVTRWKKWRPRRLINNVSMTYSPMKITNFPQTMCWKMILNTWKRTKKLRKFDAEEAGRREATTSALYVGRNGHPWQTLPRARTGRAAPVENISDYLQNLQIIIKIFTISAINIVENLNIIDCLGNYVGWSINKFH